ncbi:hypothetical protein [Nocardia sp. NBC_01329]|uniref:hypothetical protein n=1 Tax=Nocardia sp. NBC_01329 TaxID=2903594 RepID=UPI002E13E71D|nr:hypothetical protein OG405_16980 [Nocardia sp. NBC_01329]
MRRQHMRVSGPFHPRDGGEVEACEPVVVGEDVDGGDAVVESAERIAAVATWRDAPYFAEPERAALALVDAVLQPVTHGERIPVSVR